MLYPVGRRRGLDAVFQALGPSDRYSPLDSKGRPASLSGAGQTFSKRPRRWLLAHAQIQAAQLTLVFVQAIAKFGEKDWESVARHVGTRKVNVTVKVLNFNRALPCGAPLHELLTLGVCLDFKGSTVPAAVDEHVEARAREGEMDSRR